MKSKMIAVVCVLALVLTTGTQRAFGSNYDSTANPGSIAIDAVLVRPACFVATIVGGALFIISLPVAIPSRSVHRAAHALVVKPADATFKRPLGDFEDLSAD
jgi:hypothetical protein